jgi:hypothetical protein
MVGLQKITNLRVAVGKNVNKMNIIVFREDLKYIQESIDSGEVLQEDLRRWFKEKWVDVSKKVDGKHPPCGRKDADGKSYPKCRPSKKISKETPMSNPLRYKKIDRLNENMQKRTIIQISESQFERLFEFNEETPVLIYEDHDGSVQNTNFEFNGLLNEAEYQGKKVQLGKIMQGDIKKFKVYVKNDKGKVVKVNFGFGGKSAKGKRMVIKKNNPERRKSFRARMNCDNPGPRWKPRYWACKSW